MIKFDVKRIIEDTTCTNGTFRHALEAAMCQLMLACIRNKTCYTKIHRDIVKILPVLDALLESVTGEGFLSMEDGKIWYSQFGHAIESCVKHSRLKKRLNRTRRS